MANWFTRTFFRSGPPVPGNATGGGEPVPRTAADIVAGSGKPVDPTVVSIDRARTAIFGESFPRVNEDELIAKKGVKVYAKMRTDEQVKAVVTFKRDAILSRGWTFEFDQDSKLSDTEKAKRKRVTEQIIRQLPGSFVDALNVIAVGREYGFSLTEKVYQKVEVDGDTYVGLRGLFGRDPSTFNFYTDIHGDLIKCEQEAGGVRIPIELDKFIHYVHNPEFDRWFGRSDLREAYRAWYSKDMILRFWPLFLERFGSGFLIAQLSSEANIPVGSAAYAELQDVVTQAKTAAGIVSPPGVTIDVKYPATTEAFEKACTWNDLAIAKALLVPNLAGVSHTGQTGAYSQAQSQLEAFAWTLKADADRLESCIDEQLFRDLGEQNWADGEYPCFKFKPLSGEQLRWIIDTWTKLVQAKAVIATDVDEARLREILEMPPREEDSEPLVDPNQVSAQQATADGRQQQHDLGQEAADNQVKRGIGEDVARAKNPVLAAAAEKNAKARAEYVRRHVEVFGFDPNEPRDESGKWTSGGDSSAQGQDRLDRLGRLEKEAQAYEKAARQRGGIGGSNSDTMQTLAHPLRRTEDALNQINDIAKKSGAPLESVARALDGQGRWQGGWATVADEWEAANKLGGNALMSKTTKEALTEKPTYGAARSPLSSDDLSAYAARQAWHQEEFRKQYGDELTVYRGVSGKYGKSISGTPGTEATMPSYALSSWSTDARVAMDFARKSGGTVVSTKIAPRDVWMMPRRGVQSPLRYADASGEIVLHNREPNRTVTIVHKKLVKGAAVVASLDHEDEWMNYLQGRPLRAVRRFSITKRDAQVALASARERVDFAVIDRKQTVAAEELKNQLADVVAKAVKKELGTEADVAALTDANTEDIGQFDIGPVARGRLKIATQKGLAEAWALGRQTAQAEVRKTSRKFARGLFEFADLRDKAASYFESNAFKVAGDVSDRARSIIQQELLTSVKNGRSPVQTRTAIWDRLVARGLTSPGAVRSVETEEDVISALNELWQDTAEGAAAYLDTVARTNLFSAMNEARYAEFSDPALGDFVLALRYSAVLDEHTTDICTALDDSIWATDSELWDTYRPPNHFNCRSVLVPITAIDVQDGLWDRVESPEPIVEPQEGFGK